MRAVGFALLLLVAVSALASANGSSNGPAGPLRLTMFHPGPGVSHPLPHEDRNALWSDPPDLNGLIGSSEQILQFGMESEIANDFVLSADLVRRVVFWGGCYNNATPCEAGIPTPGFNFEFFDDADCRPGNLVAYLVITDFRETPVGCQGGAYPVYEWSAPLDMTFAAGVRYWFCAQFRDHAFPPQAGRLSAVSVRGCESMFRSAYWGYPDWTPVGEDWYPPIDMSQEFSGPETDAGGACCLQHGMCRIISETECAAQGGSWQGTGIACDMSTCAEGACCSPNGACRMTTNTECAAPAIWEGIGTDCYSATCAPRAPGSIAVWGPDGGLDRVPDPNSGFKKLAVLGSHCLAVRRDGTLIAWGYNEQGQCNVPQGLRDPIGIAAGWYHSLAIRPDRSIVGWGWNYNHQCDPPAPDTGFVAVCAGSSHSLGLTSDGRVLAWGNNYKHQCDVPDPGPDFVAIAAGIAHSMALRRDGSIVAWGWNDDGECDVPSPNTGFIAMAGGTAHSLGLKADGTIVAWGRNSDGQCDVPEPNAHFIAVAAGLAHSLGLKGDGSIVAWGANDHGECNIPRPNVGFVAIGASSNGASLAISRDVAIAPPPPSAEGGPLEKARAIAGAEGEVAAGASLGASPNPSGGFTRLDFDLSRAAHRVDIEVYDAAGRVVRRFALGSCPVGHHSLPWDGNDDDGRPLPAGVYLVRMRAAGEARAGRIVLLAR